MAHYIVDDRGFGGVWYTCSNCGAIYWDILEDVDMHRCRTCGEEIDLDKNEVLQ